MPTENYPAVEFIRQCLREEDGRLFWRKRPREHFQSDSKHRMWNTQHVGKEAGGIQGDRWRVCFRWKPDGSRTNVLRSLIVWAFHHGQWPTCFIDHRNRNSLDDRIENLRPATVSQNGANCQLPADNKSGYKGVSWDKVRGKWTAHITVHRRSINLGRFDDPAEAHAVYMMAAQKYFGEFASNGKISG